MANQVVLYCYIFLLVVPYRLDEENSHQRTLFTRKQKEANRDFTR